MINHLENFRNPSCQFITSTLDFLPLREIQCHGGRPPQDAVVSLYRSRHFEPNRTAFSMACYLSQTNSHLHCLHSHHHNKNRDHKNLAHTKKHFINHQNFYQK